VWLHLRPCLVPSWCGANRSIRDCYWPWLIDWCVNSYDSVKMKQMSKQTYCNCVVCRRGFTIRLKRLKPRAPDYGGPKILGVRTISGISICFLFWFNARFYHASNKRSLQKNERDKWQWMTMSSLFSWPCEWVIVTYVWNKTPESIFSNYSRPVRSTYPIDM